MVNPVEPSLEQAKFYIYSLDFSLIINKLIKYEGWIKKGAINVCQLYKNYLFLNKKYGNRYGLLPPSDEIDSFWHYHILDTKNYQKDCLAIFGEYFHHYPYFGIDQKSNFNDLYASFQILQQLHYQEFGDFIYKIKIKKRKKLFSFSFSQKNF